MCAGKLHAGDLFCSFINNFIIQLCFSTASYNYGNQLQSLEERLGLRQEGKKRFSNIFPQHIFTCDFWLYEGSLSSQSMESLSSPWKKKATYRQSAHKQTSTTSHHLPAACNADTVWGAASSRLAQLGFHSLLQYISSPYNVALFSYLHSCEHLTSPTDPLHTVRFVFSPVGGDDFLWHPTESLASISAGVLPLHLFFSALMHVILWVKV